LVGPVRDPRTTGLAGTEAYDVDVSDGHDSSRWRVLVVAPVAAAQMLLAALAASQPALALGLIAGVVVVAAALLAPLLVLIGAFPATFAYWRVGPVSVDMSVADALTFLGAIAALPYVPWRSPTLRRVLVAALGYSAVLLLTVLAHPASRSLIEVFHRASMVVGAVLIGAAVARLGKVQLALRVFLAAAAVISIVAAVDTLAHHFQPAYPFGIQKNAAGELIVMALVIMLAVPRRVGLPRPQTAVLSTILLVGLAASEARGAALALVAVFAIHLLRLRRRGGTSRIVRMAPLLLAASIILIGMSVVTYRDRDLSASTQQFNSLNTRLETYDYAINNVWKPHLLDGSGLKWFFAPGSPVGAPHNLVISELSEAGLIGLAALVIFLAVVLRSARRSSSNLGDAAFLVLVARLLEAMLGIFWTAGVGTLPFLVLGLMIGDEEEEVGVAGAARVTAVRG
jgi:O-antigen ligase